MLLWASMADAIVLDGQLKSALAAARQLARAGITVHVGSTYRTAMARYSRAAARHFTYPSPEHDRDAFITALIADVQHYATPPVMYAFSDATFLTIAAYRDKLAPYCQLVLPPASSITTAFDKEQTGVLAQSLGITTIPELTQATVEEYPVVVKPRQSLSWHGGAGTFGTAEFVFTAAELTEQIERFTRETGQPPLIQSLIVGSEYGVELMCQHGKVLQSFTHKRIRSLSPRGGAATVKMTAKPTEATATMLRIATRLCGTLNWTGPMMVEFKVERSTNTVYLMEINGRFWGSLPLPLAAGVDFVNGYYALATGAPLPEVAAPLPIVTQHFLGDLKWLLQVWWKRDPLRARLYPARLAALIAVGRSTLFDRGDVWRWRDPLPALMELVYAIVRR